MWTFIGGAIVGGLLATGATLVWAMDAMARREQEHCRKVDEARAKLARFHREQDPKTGRFKRRISPELDAMLTEAEAAAALDSAP